MNEIEFEQRINEVLSKEINNVELFNNEFNAFYNILLNSVNILDINELIKNFKEDELKKYYSFINSIKDLYIIANSFSKIMKKNIDEMSKMFLENYNIEDLLFDEINKSIENMGFIKNALKKEHKVILQIIDEEYDKYLIQISNNIFNIINNQDYLLNNVSNKKIISCLEINQPLTNMNLKILNEFLINKNYEIVLFITDELFYELSKEQIIDILKNINSEYLLELINNKIQIILKKINLQELFNILNLDNYSLIYKYIKIDKEEDLDYLIENNKLEGIEVCNSVLNNKSFVKKIIKSGRYEIFSYLSLQQIDDEILSMIDCEKIINSNYNTNLIELLKDNKVFETFLLNVNNRYQLLEKIGADNITKDMVNICVINGMFVSKNLFNFDESQCSEDVLNCIHKQCKLPDIIKFAYENNRMEYCESCLLSGILYHWFSDGKLEYLNLYLNIYKNEPIILAFIKFFSKNHFFDKNCIKLIKSLIKSMDDIKKHFDEFGPKSDEFYDLAFKDSQICDVLIKYYNLKGHYKGDLAVSNYINMYVFLPYNIKIDYIESRENIYKYFRKDGSFTDELYDLVLITDGYYKRFNLKDHYKNDNAIISYIENHDFLPRNIKTLENKEEIYKYFKKDGSFTNELYDLVLITGNYYDKFNLKEHYKDDKAIISYIENHDFLPRNIKLIKNKDIIYKYFKEDGSFKDELYDLVLLSYSNYDYFNLKQHYKDDKAILCFIKFVKNCNNIIDIFKNKNDIYMYFNEFGPTKEFNNYFKNNKIYEKDLLNDFINNYISINKFDDEFFNIFKLYIIDEYFNGNKDKYDNILKYLGTKILLNLDNDNVLKLINMDEDTLNKWFNNGSLQQFFDFIISVNVSSDIVEYFLNQKKIDVPLEYLEILNSYNYDKIKFLTNYNLYIDFLKKMDIEDTKFIQYVFNVDFDWFSTMLYIINNNKIDEFIRVKEYFYKIMQSNNEISKMKSFIKILVNYQKYPELCVNILNQDLQQELLNNITFLFNSTEYIDPSLIKNTSDLLNLKEIFKNKYQREINNQMSIDDIKDNLCKILFNMNLKTVHNKLKIYGDTLVLRQLIFNNRNNIEIIDLITEMMIYTSMMEAIALCNDLDYLIEMGKKILNNYELSLSCMMLFSEFDEKMRTLYENELIINLTVLNNVEGLLDEEMSKKYGVDVIDFSDKKYCLAYHVKSYTETPDELINGLSSRNKNTISLSIGSNRNQIVYHKNGLIFATDEIPNGVFIKSSTRNMSSNGTIKKGSFKDIASNRLREQRGALETSIAPFGHNSEVLCFRDGIKFKYIILPGGREPTVDELKIAYEYGLKFIKTQKLYKAIDNPKDIESSYLKNNGRKMINNKIEQLKSIKENIMNKNNSQRRIAIFTDSHALFEPTLAILEDARKCGITEIYSLGDNIGTGPNPKEVMELLLEYGVKSLKGNHEIYATNGVEELKKHLKNAYEEARRNSSWTRTQLTLEQIDEIKNNPEERIIEIGGEKILLTHFTCNYNTGDLKNVPIGIKNIFQGHIHFEKESFNGVITLRGAGIGHGKSDIGNAYYIILTERVGGGYDIEKRVVPYDINNLKYDILESSLEDKAKIESWVGIKR